MIYPGFLIVPEAVQGRHLNSRPASASQLSYLRVGYAAEE